MFGVADVGKNIVEYAKRNQIDTIIMGSRGLGRVRGFVRLRFIGNVLGNF